MIASGLTTSDTGSVGCDECGRYTHSVIGLISPLPETNENSANGLSAVDARSAINAVRADFGGAGLGGVSAAAAADGDTDDDDDDDPCCIACLGYRRLRLIFSTGIAMRGSGGPGAGGGGAGRATGVNFTLVYSRGGSSSFAGSAAEAASPSSISSFSFRDGASLACGSENDDCCSEASGDDRGEGSMVDSIDGCNDVIVAFSLPPAWNENVVLDVVRVCDRMTVSLCNDGMAAVSSANRGREEEACAFDASVTHNVGADCLRRGVGGKGLSCLFVALELLCEYRLLYKLFTIATLLLSVIVANIVAVVIVIVLSFAGRLLR